MYKLIDTPISNSFIYGMIDPFDGSIRYIGRTSNGESRFKGHFSKREFKKKTHKVNWFKSILNKNGIIEIIILEEATPEKLNELEQFYIIYFKFLGAKLTNLTDGGEGTSGRKMSKAERLNLSIKKKGKKFSDEHKANLKKAFKNRKITNQTKEKLKIRKDCKMVINLKTKEIFPSLMEASRVFNLSSGALCDHLNRKTTHVKTHRFSWFNQLDDINLFCLNQNKGLDEQFKFFNEKRYQFKKVKCMKTNLIFNSLNEASAYFNITNTYLCDLLKNRKKSTKYCFEYYND